MGVNRSKIQNIKIMKRGSTSTTMGKTATVILTASAELDPITLLRKNCRETMKEKFQSFYHHPITRERVLEDLQIALNGKIFSQDLWDNNKVLLTLEPGRIGRYATENRVDFHLREKNNRDATLVEGTLHSTRGSYDGGKRGYEFTFEIEKLNPVSAEEKAKLKNRKKIPKLVDPTKVVTPQELQQLQTFESKIAGATEMLPSYYRRMSNVHYYGHDQLLQHLRNNVFTDPNSQYSIKVTDLGVEATGELRFGFYRLHSKKTTYRETLLMLVDDAPPIKGSYQSNHFHIVKIENPKQQP